MTIDKNGAKPNIYTSITNQIVAALEQGVKPWNAAHAAGHVSRPLRHSAQPYAGINVLTLWCSAMERHYAAPIWMTFRQALELGVRASSRIQRTVGVAAHNAAPP